MSELSRREFVVLAAAGSAAVPLAVHGGTARAAAALTAQDIVDRIKRNVGVDWKAETVDTFKAGDPATPVKGLATTAMATLEVLKKAVASGANFIITCEPTFYGRADSATPPAAHAADPVFAAKEAFIRTNGLVVWRFSDHWRLRRPDPLAQGLSDALGLSRPGAAADPARLSIPAITLEALASQVKTKLDARGGIRVVGDPGLEVQTVGLLPGSTPIQAALGMLPAVDVVISGEVREWESVEYARDKVSAGEKKALILVGRVLSEDPGMNVCATWLAGIVPELTTTWMRAGDPYWRPR